MFFIPKTSVNYPDLKARLIHRSWIVGLLGVLLLFIFNRHFVVPYIMGVILGYGYIFSLFMTAEYPQRKLTIGLSIIRMATLSFLIAWVGHFKLLDTCVVFSGFLSYKLVLVLEFVRHSVGIKLNSGN